MVEITNLTNEDRDKLLLNMAEAMLDLSSTIKELVRGIDLLLAIVMGPMEKGDA